MTRKEAKYLKILFGIRVNNVKAYTFNVTSEGFQYLIQRKNVCLANLNTKR